MVLVCGFDIDKETLPFSGAIEYIIKKRDKDIKMLKRTKLLEKCSAVYVMEDFKDLIDKLYSNKTIIVNSVNELTRYLTGEPSTEVAEDDSLTIVSTYTETEAGPSAKTRKTARKKTIPTNSNAETVNSNIPEGPTETEKQLRQQIELLQEDSNIMSSQIEMQESELLELNETVKLRDSEIESLNAQLSQLSDELYKYKNNTETAKLLNDLDLLQFDNANLQENQRELSNRVTQLEHQLEEERKQFEIDKQEYANIIDQYEREDKCNELLSILSDYTTVGSKAKLHPQFNVSPELKEQLKTATVVCCGSNVDKIMQCVLDTLTRNNNMDAVIVDLTGDMQLSMALKLMPHLRERGSMLNLLKGDNPANIVQRRGKTDIIMSESFNDISLLTVDWGNVLTNLMKYASGRPVYILMGHIRSFAVRYTAMLLADAINTHIVVDTDPLALLNIIPYLNSMQNDKVNVIIMNYANKLKELIDKVLKIQKSKVKVLNTGFTLDNWLIGSSGNN